jgi:hypothetical protein
MREEVEASVSRHCLIAGFGMVMGGEGEMPDPVEMIDQWEASLSAAPEQLENPEDYEILKALGLRK